jgi:predicted O-methyltransferase YrrM
MSFKQQYLRRWYRAPHRLWFAFSYFRPGLRNLLSWTVSSREESNFTYELTAENLDYLAHTLAVVTDRPFAMVRAYIDEAPADGALRSHVLERTRHSASRYEADDRCEFGRRLGWYALVRLLRPRVVVETGVDKGHGAVLLCAALLRNESEGFPGRYFGTDINPRAGWLLGAPYDRVGRILYGDSIESIGKLEGPIDLFINDSDHSAEYEYREYQAVSRLLSERAVILGDNAHATSKLAQFSRETGRRFVFFREVPKNHWYPGAGIGIAFQRAAPTGGEHA